MYQKIFEIHFESYELSHAVRILPCESELVERDHRLEIFNIDTLCIVAGTLKSFDDVYSSKIF